MMETTSGRVAKGTFEKTGVHRLYRYSGTETYHALCKMQALTGTQDPDQGLQQFVSQSSWDNQAVGQRYRALTLAGL